MPDVIQSTRRSTLNMTNLNTITKEKVDPDYITSSRMTLLRNSRGFIELKLCLNKVNRFEAFVACDFRMPDVYEACIAVFCNRNQ